MGQPRGRGICRSSCSGGGLAVHDTDGGANGPSYVSVKGEGSIWREHWRGQAVDKLSTHLALAETMRYYDDRL